MLGTLLLALFGAADAGTAPQAVLEGHVRSKGNRAPIAAAMVAIDEGAPVETTADGAFRFELTPGEHTVTVTASGYEPRSFVEELFQGTRLTVRYALQPRGPRPFETVVRGERDRTELARVVLDGDTMREVAGTANDPLRATLLMPGISVAVSGIGVPVVRGSAPSSTGYFIDGVRVPQLFHVFLGPAVISADLIDRIDFMPGGAPVRYGRLSGGAIEARLTKPSQLRFEGHADLVNAGAFAEAVVPATNTAISLGGRVSYSQWLFEALPKAGVAMGPSNSRLIADFWDYQGRLEQPLGRGTLRVLALGSSDRFGNRQGESEAALSSVTFHRADARWRSRVGPGELEAGFTFGWDRFGSQTDRAFDIIGPLKSSATANFTQHAYSARLVWAQALSDQLSYSVGLGGDHLRASFELEQTVTGLDRPIVMRKSIPEQHATFGNLWGELKWMPGPKLSVTLGARGDVFGTYQASAEPRLAASWVENEQVTVRAAVGMYHQPPAYLINVPLADIGSLGEGLQRVVQTGAGFTFRPFGALELSADAYLNWMPQLVEVSITDPLESKTFNPTDPPKLGPPSAQKSSGLAYGVDLMLRLQPRGRFFGWLTLTAQRSVRTRELDDKRIADVPYAFDQSLVMNAVAGVRLPWGLTAGLVVHFNTGRPESGDLGSRTRVPGTITVRGMQFENWVVTPLDQVDRLPPYFRLDLRFAKLWQFDAFRMELYLDILNVVLRPEVLGYSYGGGFGTPLTKKTRDALVFVPTLGLQVRY